MTNWVCKHTNAYIVDTHANNQMKVLWLNPPSIGMPHEEKNVFNLNRLFHVSLNELWSHTMTNTSPFTSASQHTLKCKLISRWEYQMAKFSRMSLEKCVHFNIRTLDDSFNASMMPYSDIRHCGILWIFHMLQQEYVVLNLHWKSKEVKTNALDDFPCSDGNNK